MVNDRLTHQDPYWRCECATMHDPDETIAITINRAGTGSQSGRSCRTGDARHGSVIPESRALMRVQSSTFRCHSGLATIEHLFKG